MILIKSRTIKIRQSSMLPVLHQTTCPLKNLLHFVCFVLQCLSSSRLLFPVLRQTLPVRHLHGGEPGGPSLQLEVSPGGGGPIRLPCPVDHPGRHGVRAVGGTEVAGGDVQGPGGGSRGEARGRGLFADHQRRSDRRHGEIRELHGGGRSEVQENQGLHSECQAVCVRLVQVQMVVQSNHTM